jgi:CRISPR-associated endonuclease Cas1
MANPNSKKQTVRTRYSDPPAPPRRSGIVYVVEGFGVRVRVHRGQLVVEDGYGRDRRKRVFSRPLHDLSRLIVLGHEGAVTLEAIRWLTDLGIPYQHIDRDGRVLLISVPAADDARLRRAQALAIGNTTGLEIARMLLREKLVGQRSNLTRIIASAQDSGEDHLEPFTTAVESLESASAVNELLIAERDAALAYWSAWAPVSTRFRKCDLPLVPTHWLHFGRRGSPLTSAPRSAINPPNALLNYLYAILEAETRIACLIVGLDPTLGIVHGDYRSRDSLALDVMEAVRPHVDAYVLELLERKTFRATDFHETRRGVCRVVAPLTHELVNTAPAWADRLAPIVERVALALASTPGSHVSRLATPLTNAKRHTGRDQMRKHPRTRSKLRAPKVDRRCHRCGGEVPHRRRVYCDDCLPHFQREQLERATGALSPVEVVRARTGADVTHGGEAAAKRGASISSRKREIAEWERRHGKLIDLTAFEHEILPLIREVPLSALVRATGLSLRYCSQIRRGEKTPHPRHWQALRAVEDAASG